jgi:hypothetical protein
MKKTIELSGLNFVSYFVLTFDFRTVAQANYLWAAITNLIIAMLTFTVLNRVSESKSTWDRFGYAVGGTCGTMVGIYISKLILGR